METYTQNGGARKRDVVTCIRSGDLRWPLKINKNVQKLLVT